MKASEKVTDVPRVSVIIASYGRCEDLKLALGSIRDSAYPNLEILLIDDAVQDSTARVAELFDVTLLHSQESQGLAQAINQALALATGDYIVLMSGDAVMAKDWIRNLVDFLETHPQGAAAGGKTYFWNESNPVGDLRYSYFAYTIVDAETGAHQTSVDAPDAVRRVATLSERAVMIRRKAIADVGGVFLEPVFVRYFGEADFFARAIRKGWDLFFLPDAVVWHRVQASAKNPSSYRSAYYTERNRTLYAYRNFEDKELERFESSVRRKIMLDSWRWLLKPFGGMGMDYRARWDAWTWCREHLSEILQERAVLMRDERVPFNAAVRALQSNAEIPPPLEEDDTHERVSIIIANYNYGRFLGDAIESALAQTYPNVEVIVVDDGSSDDSLEIAKRYPVHLLPQQNQGVGAARNRGASVAHGEYLVFLDADDVLETAYVTRCLEALRQQDASVAYAYTGMRYFGAESRIYCSHAFDSKTLLKGNFIHASSLVRRSAFDAVGGFNPTWRLGHEDYELWIRMLHHGLKGVLVPEPLLNYRRHEVGRNRLSRMQLRELRWRMRLTYPGFYWSKLLKDPIRTAYFLIRLRGCLHRRHASLNPSGAQ